MTDWTERAADERTRPLGLRVEERVEYRLQGDDTCRFAAAGELAWGAFPEDDGRGRIAAWRRATAVGDVNGTTKGSGARFNGSKPDLSLIPAGVMAALVPHAHLEQHDTSWETVLRLLGEFQMGGPHEVLYQALAELDHDGNLWADCARVFSYGKEKYAAWNWARGMAWSIPLACALRHIVFGNLQGEEIDPESGLPHRGHIACNIVMLLWFIDYYPEGDDRPELPQ